MNQAIHRLRLFFCLFSGEDDFIIRNCNTRIQFAFALIGLFVQIIFAGCWISASLFMSHLFDGARWVSVPIGIIWAMLVTNLYLLLLYTISPPILPNASKKRKGKKIITTNAKKDKHYLFSLSFLIRIGLIVLLAIIIMQPYNVQFFSPSFEESDQYAKAIREVWSSHRLSWVVTVLGCVLFLLPIYSKYRIRAISNNNFEKDFTDEHGKSNILRLREQLTNPTDFGSLSKLVLSTDIKSIKTADFYFQKALLEYRVILEEYEQFKKEFSAALMRKNREYNQQTWEKLMPFLNKLKKIAPDKYSAFYNQIVIDLQEENIELYEYWADPPFRTKNKNTTRVLVPEEALIHSYYQNKS